MAIHTDLPIHKTGTELVKLSYEVHKELPRGFKQLGTELTGHCMAMVSLMAMANATTGQERATHIRALLARHNAATVLLRVGYLMGHIKQPMWARATPIVNSVGAQAGGWLKSAFRKTAPAA